jgi:hypothetical protein
MRDRKYLIGALVGVIGALTFSGVASATPISQTLQTTLSPRKQDEKKFAVSRCTTSSARISTISPRRSRPGRRRSRLTRTSSSFRATFRPVS